VVRAKTLVSVLRTWAEFADTIPAEANAEVSLDPLRRMVEAAGKEAAMAAQRVGSLIDKSSRSFFPGDGDPLGAHLKIGSHRWLADDREGSYSDWLAWMRFAGLGRIGGPAEAEAAN